MDFVEDRITYFGSVSETRLEAQRFKAFSASPQLTGHTAGSSLQRLANFCIKGWYMFEALWASYSVCCIHVFNSCDPCHMNGSCS